MSTALTNRNASGWALFNAMGWALLVHLLLFTVVRPTSGRVDQESVQLDVPQTQYMARSVPNVDGGVDVRRLWSPVLFSMPSPLGFSQTVLEKKIDFDLTVESKPRQASYLDVEPFARRGGLLIDASRLKIAAPEMPLEVPRPAGLPLAATRAPSPRFYMTPQLQHRLQADWVLPEALNALENGTWEVAAQVCVTKEGEVREVFLQKPLDDAPLNQQVLRAIYDLRFKPGPQLQGVVELYSPQGRAPTQELP